MPATRRHAALGLVLLLLLLGCSTPRSTAAAGTTLLGVYYGNQGWKMDQVKALESWQGKQNATVVMFTDFCDRSIKNLFGQQLPNIWNNRNVPLITWEPFLCSTTPNDVEVRIARGEYDAYLNSWADKLRQWLSGPDGVYGSADDRRAYLRLAHEMNGDWYPWGAALGGNQPADYVAMWRHVRAIFSARGLDATRVQWIWTVNNEDIGGAQAEQFYPGDASVDWVAIDGYNWGASESWSTWRSADLTFDPMLTRLRAITTKPVAITEVGSTTATSAGVDVAAKSAWISRLFAYTQERDIRMVAWFNEDKETDWALFGGVNGDSVFAVGRTKYKTYASYKAAVGGAGFVGTSAAQPRLLTDTQFAGQ